MILESTIFLHDPDKEDDFYIKNNYFIHDWVSEHCSFLHQTSDVIEYSVTHNNLLEMQEVIDNLLSHMRKMFDTFMYRDFDNIEEFEDTKDELKKNVSSIAGVLIRDNIDIDFYNKLIHINEMITTLINKNKAKMIYTYRGNI